MSDRDICKHDVQECAFCDNWCTVTDPDHDGWVVCKPCVKKLGKKRVHEKLKELISKMYPFRGM